MKIIKQEVQAIADLKAGYTLGHADVAILNELARIALASLEAEPVAYVDPFAFHNFSIYRAGETDNKRMGREWMWANPDAGLIPVYTAPPAPVSVPDESAVELLATDLMKRIDKITGERHSVATLSSLRVSIVEACRAAMLQGADDEVGSWHNDKNTPASHTCDEHIRYESNAGGNLWIQCSKQMKAAGMLTRVLTSVFYDTPQNQQQNIPENIPTLRDGLAAIRNSGIAIDAEKILAERDAINSPVIPDGICPCCGRKQLKNRTWSVSGWDGKHVARGFCIKHYAIERKKDPSRRESIRAADKRYRARKAAAPQQEVK